MPIEPSPGPLSVVPLHDRGRVDAGAECVFRELLTQTIADAVEAFLHVRVVVVALRVSRDAARHLIDIQLAPACFLLLLGNVIPVTDTEDRLCTGDELARVDAFLGMSRKVCHFTMSPTFEPRQELVRVINRPGSAHTSERKALIPAALQHV